MAESEGNANRSAAGDTLNTALSALRRGDFAVATGVIAILIVMIFPVPQWTLDLLLSISISLAVVIMMITCSSPSRLTSTPFRQCCSSPPCTGWR